MGNFWSLQQSFDFSSMILLMSRYIWCKLPGWGREAVDSYPLIALLTGE